ncbi:MAG: DUF167 domain-containing protein [Alphaproteobacteria bacterium]|nr:DUF167 domain-containing protein [Alphaproteobacteria bacterium]
MTTAGLRLRVRVTPRAGGDRLDSLIDLPDGPALKITVSAPPEDGKANAALCRLLAKFFGIAKSNLTVVSGPTARLKQIEIAGDGAALAAVLDAWAAAAETRSATQ